MYSFNKLIDFCNQEESILELKLKKDTNINVEFIIKNHSNSVKLQSKNKNKETIKNPNLNHNSTFNSILH